MQRRFNRRQRIALYLHSSGKCAICGLDLGKGWHADHVNPWSIGGSTDVINGQALCPTCNLRKGNKVMGDFIVREWQNECLSVYLRSDKKSFLIDATPGAGKTAMAVMIADQEIRTGKCDAVLVITPSRELCKSTAEAFTRYSDGRIELNNDWKGENTTFKGTTFKGAIVTYQWLLMNVSLVRIQSTKHKLLVIIDEPHHCSDGYSKNPQAWGVAIKETTELAQKILLITGTPFRTDKNPIPYVEYDNNKKACPDFRFSYGQALQLKEQVVRKLFFPRSDGTMEWATEDGIQKATFQDDDINERGMSCRLRTALNVNGDFLQGVLKNSFHDLKQMRETDSDAGMLILAMDISHANDIANLIRNAYNIDPCVVTSDDPKAIRAIQAFRASDDPIIIAVGMVSEGVDIPRLRVLAYLTNIVAPLYVLQSFGRVSRVEKGHRDHTSKIHLPSDSRLCEIALSLMGERDDALKDPKPIWEGPGGEGPLPGCFFNPLGSTHHSNGVIVGDIVMDQQELVSAEAYRQEHPHLHGISLETIALFIHDIPNHKKNNIPFTEEIKTHTEKLANIRKKLQAIVSSIAQKHGLDYAYINSKLNRHVGITSVGECDDLGKLEERLSFAVKWLGKGDK